MKYDVISYLLHFFIFSDISFLRIHTLSWNTWTQIISWYFSNKSRAIAYETWSSYTTVRKISEHFAPVWPYVRFMTEKTKNQLNFGKIKTVKYLWTEGYRVVSCLLASSKILPSSSVVYRGWTGHLAATVRLSCRASSQCCSNSRSRESALSYVGYIVLC